MATNKNNGQLRPADIARGRGINNQKLAELERAKDAVKPQGLRKYPSKTGGFV